MSAMRRFVMVETDQGADIYTRRALSALSIIIFAAFWLFAVNLLFFLSWAPHPVLCLFQAGAALCCVVSFAANKKQHRNTAATIMTLTIGVMAIVWTLFLGLKIQFHWYILSVLLPHYLFVDIEGSHRTILILYLVLCLNAALFMGLQLPPLLDMNQAEFMTWFTSSAVFVTLLFELALNSITSRMIRSDVAQSLSAATDDSMTDPLTQLWNRRYLQEHEQQIIEDALRFPYCVAILDIDFFKKVNDTYGHPIGDKMLIHLSQTMKSSFRSTDTLIRWGGEEFVVILANTSLRDAVDVINSFCRLIARSPLVCEVDTIPFTLSAGVCRLNSKDSLYQALELADKCLYAAKHRGRDQVIDEFSL